MVASRTCFHFLSGNILAWVIVFSLIYIPGAPKTMAHQNMPGTPTFLLHSDVSLVQSVSSALSQTDKMPVYAVREKSGSFRCVLMGRDATAESAHFEVVSENPLEEGIWEMDELYLGGEIFPVEGLLSLGNKVSTLIWVSCLEEHSPCEIGYVYNKNEKRWFLILKKEGDSYFRYDADADQFVECDGEAYKNFALPLDTVE